MEDLKNYAIILIYPDGVFEKIPITIHSYHILYLQEHINTSKKFKSIAGFLINFINDHFSMSRALANANVIEIANKDMCLKIKNEESYKTYIPQFTVYLPTHLESMDTLTALEKITSVIPKEKLTVDKMVDGTMDFKKMQYEEYLDFLEYYKNELEKERRNLR